MWARLEPWQLLQLQRLAKLDPQRVEMILNTLWNRYQGLYTELAVSAVDQEMLSVGDCAERLSVPAEQIEKDLVDFRCCAGSNSAAPTETVTGVSPPRVRWCMWTRRRRPSRVIDNRRSSSASRPSI